MSNIPSRPKRTSTVRHGATRVARKPAVVRSSAGRGRRRFRSLVSANQKAIIYRAPNQYPVPQEYFTKLHCKVLMIFGTAVGSPFTNGFYHSYIGAMSLIQPFQNIVNAGITYPTGYASTVNPTGLSTLLNANYYQRYQVVATKLRLKCSPSTTVTNDTLLVTVTPSIVNTTPTNTGTAVDQPGTKQKIMHPTTVNKDCTLSISTKWHKWFGIDKKVYNNDTSGQYNSLYNSAPSTGAYYVLNFQMLDGVNPASSVPVEIDMTYYVRCYGLVAASFG